MAPRSDLALSQNPAAAGHGLFLREWLTHPLRMGSIVPSSPALCRRIVRNIRREPDECVLELGAGTGVISRALRTGGVPSEKLIVVEIAADMAAHLHRILPGTTVIEGDARALSCLLPKDLHGRIGSIVCGIPLVMLPFSEQKRFIDAIGTVAPGSGFLHYSYCVTSPLPWRKHRLTVNRVALDTA